MKTSISINDFHFRRTGFGRYYVTYQSPKTFREWGTTVTDMQIIDSTKYSESPRTEDLERLKQICKAGDIVKPGYGF